MTPASNDHGGHLAVLDGRSMPVEEAVIPVTDDGFLRGDAVFEALRVYDGRPFAVEEHLDRLERSAAGIRLTGLRRDLLAAEIDGLVAERGGDYGLRVVCTRGGRRLLMTESIPVYPQGVAVGFVTYRSTIVLNGLKTLSYAGNVLATRLAQERGFGDALLVTPEGEVLEAPTSSLFWSGDGERLITPPLGEGILASITRQALMDLLDVEERVTTPDDLAGASEAFLCSSIREVQAIGRVEDRELVSPGPLTEGASRRLREHVEARLTRESANQ